MGFLPFGTFVEVGDPSSLSLHLFFQRGLHSLHSCRTINTSFGQGLILGGGRGGGGVGFCGHIGWFRFGFEYRELWWLSGSMDVRFNWVFVQRLFIKI